MKLAIPLSLLLTFSVSCFAIDKKPTLENKKTIYFAAPLFNVAERTFNEQCVQKLEAAGFEVFLPQRDLPAALFDRNYLTPDERFKQMFSILREHLLKADILLVVLDGRVPDEGVCIELGMAYCQRYLGKCDHKIIIGLFTDSHRAFDDEPLNLMISESLDFIADDCLKLIAYLMKQDMGFENREH